MPEPNAELLRLTAALNRMKPEQQAAVAPEPEPTEESLLSQIGGAGLSAVGAVGNFLDLPGSMVRDVMVGDNPLDQLLPWNWFSSEGRAGGREMLDRNVATGAFFTPNKETGMSGWIDDPWEGVQDIAGFAAEMALDPLSWLTGGARTAGQLAAKKAAGYADDVPGVKFWSKANFAGKADKFGDTLETLDPGTYVGRAINKQVKNATGYQMDEHLARWFKGTKATKAAAEAAKAVARTADKMPRRDEFVKLSRARWGDRADEMVKLSDGVAGTWAKDTGRPQDEFPGYVQQFPETDVADLPPGALRQDVMPQWYSQLARVVREKVGGKIGKDQLKATLKKAGVKDEEVEWAELDDLFEEVVGYDNPDFGDDDYGVGKVFEAAFGTPIKRAVVTKDELTDWIKTHGAEVGEVVYGDADVPGVKGPANYGAYTTPGGTKHREILLLDHRVKLREELEAAADEAKRQGDGAKWREIEDQLDALEGQLFQGGHWEEDGVLAHIRTHERVGGDGKRILHVDEIQSDPHQAARTQGYSKPGTKAEVAEAQRTLDDLTTQQMVAERAVDQAMDELSKRPEYPVIAEGGNAALVAAYKRASEIHLRREEADLKLHSLQGGGIPNMPFKKTWHELALKRVLKEAVDGGYDSITINSGAAVDALEMGMPEGGKYFYDDIIPSTLRKLTKKYGGKVRAGEMDVPTSSYSDGTVTHLDPDDPFGDGAFGQLLDDPAGPEFKTRKRQVTELPITQKMKDMISSQGQPLFQPESSNFKKWFGDWESGDPNASKVVDADGKPRVVYHGTSSEFTEFNSRSAMVSGNELGNGIYLTTNPEKAGGYARGDGGNIMPLYARIKNPFRVDEFLGVEQREAISRILSEDIPPSERTYQTAAPAEARFKKTNAGNREAEAFFRERQDHWKQNADGYERFRPEIDEDNENWIVKYFDPDVVGVAEHGRDAVSQLRNTYGPDYTRALSRAGIDGVISGDTLIVTDGSQIKSVNNRGTWDKSGNVLFQDGARGAVQFMADGEAIIHAMKGRDISTLAHELMHVWRRYLPEDLNKRAEAEIGKMITGPLLDNNGRWTVEAEEALASGFERYLRDGYAPSKELRSTFAKFKNWLTEIYKSIVGTPLENEVSPELRQIFDTMLTSGDGTEGVFTRARAALEKVSKVPDNATAAEKAKAVAANAALFAGDTLTAARLRANTHFEQAVQQRDTALGQTAARYATKASMALQQQANEELFPVLAAMEQELVPHMDQKEVIQYLRGLDTTMREVAEKTKEISALPVRLQKPMGRWMEFLETMRTEATAAYVNIDDLVDEMVSFAPRKASAQYDKVIESTSFKARNSGQSNGPMAIDSQELEGRRLQLFKDSSTPAINEALSNPDYHEWWDNHQIEFEEMTARGDDPAEIALKTQEVVQKISDDMQDKYADRILEDMKVETKPGNGVFRMMDATDPNKEIAQLTGKDLKALGDPKEFTDANGVTRKVYTRITEENGTQFLQHKMESRTKALAEFMYGMPELEELGGIFTNSLMGDFSDRAHIWSTVTGAAKALRETIHQGFENGLLSIKATGRDVKGKAAGRFSPKTTLGNMFADSAGYARLDVDRMLKDISETPEWKGLIPEGEDAVTWMKQLKVEVDVGKDITGNWELFIQPGKSDGWRSKTLRSFTQLFKAGVLTHPAFHSRNLFSGAIQAWIAGYYSNTSAVGAYHMSFKGQDPMYEGLEAVKDFQDAHGIDDATEAARQMYAATTGHTAFQHRDVDNLETITNPFNDFESAREALPGGVATSPLDLAKQTFDMAADAPRAWAQYIPGLKNIDALKPKHGLSGNMADIAGVIDLKGKTRQTTGFAPVVASNIVGKHVEEFNRQLVFTEFLRQNDAAYKAAKAAGQDTSAFGFQAAGAKAKEIQLDYDPKTFTPTEQQLKKVFPFYSFFTREAHWLARELMANPAGKLGKVIRATRLSEDEDTYLPEYVKNQMAIQTSEKDGSKTYLTGIGMMHEDVLTKLAPSSASEGFRNVISQTNPLLKGPLEWAFGRSSFQGGPMGGRDLDSMDPPLGRLMTAIGLQDPTPSGRAAPILGSPALEFLVSNSPASRVVSTLKNVVDHRKTVAERALHTLTGLRFTSITPQQQRSSIRDLTDALANDLGANRFEIMTISDDLIDAAGEGTPEQKKLKAIVELRKLWDRQRKAEKRAKAKEEEQ